MIGLVPQNLLMSWVSDWVPVLLIVMPLTTVPPDPDAGAEDADDDPDAAPVALPADESDSALPADELDSALPADELDEELLLDPPDSEPPEQADSMIAVVANSAAAAVVFLLAFMENPVFSDDRFHRDCPVSVPARPSH